MRYFALEGVELVGFSKAAVDYLWGKFGRNLRATEQYLYEFFQYLIVAEKQEDFPETTESFETIK